MNKVCTQMKKIGKLKSYISDIDIIKREAPDTTESSQHLTSCPLLSHWMRSNQKENFLAPPIKKSWRKNFFHEGSRKFLSIFYGFGILPSKMMVKKYCWLVTHHGNHYRCFSSFFFVQNKLSNIDN